jgi:transcriptional regulator with XRE-family HTH domain
MAGGTKKPWDRRRLRLQRLLREARIAAGLLQAELAAKIGSDQSFVSRYERGERRLDLVELESICLACETRLSALVANYEKDEPAPRRR